MPYFLNARVVFAIPTAVIVWYLVMLARKGIDGLLSPKGMALIGFLAFFSLGPILMPDIDPEFYGESQSYVPAASLYLLSIVLFLCGAGLPRIGAPWRRLENTLKARCIPRQFGLASAALLVLFLSMAATIGYAVGYSPAVLFYESPYGTAGSYTAIQAHPTMRYLYSVFVLLPVAVACASAFVLARPQAKWKWKIVAVLALSLATSRVLAAGVRFMFVYTVLGSGLIWWLIKKRDGHHIRSFLVMLGVGAVTVLVVTQLRDIRGAGGVETVLMGGHEMKGIAGFADTGFDQNLAVKAAQELLSQGQPYLWGVSYAAPFVVLMPRQWWPGKPEGADYYLTKTTVTFRNASYGVIGELYLNGGLFGVIFGMLVFGRIAGGWEETYRRCRQGDVCLLLYGASLPAFAFEVRGDFTTATSSWLYPCIILLIIGRICRVRRSGHLPVIIRTPSTSRRQLLSLPAVLP